MKGIIKLQKNSNPFEYFVILSGGGVRGTAYIGVFRALENLGVDISGIAGASVGSIFASLFALGYTTDEMEELFLDLKYEQFQDINFSLNKNYGIWKGESVFNWARELVEKKFYGENYQKNENAPVTFDMIDKDLVIISTDITQGKYKEFSKYATPKESIAMAIRSSTSIPGFYQPVEIDESWIVDGDIIRGLPFWSLSSSLNPLSTRILEFRLEGSNNEKITSHGEYLTSIINSASNISTDFIMQKYSQNDKYDYIKIDAKDVKPVDFGIVKERKKELMDIGFSTTYNYFYNDLKIKKGNLAILYQEILDDFRFIKELIKKSKSVEFKLLVTKTLLLIIKNKDILNQNTYEKCIEILENITSSIKISYFFKRVTLSNQSKLLLELDQMIGRLNKEQIELKEQLFILAD